MRTVAARALAPTRSRLANGVTVIAKRSSATPAVTLHASFEAGSIYDPPETIGLAHFVAKAIDRGTNGRTAEAIANMLDERGVSLSITVSRHSLSFVCTCLVEDLIAVLDVLADITVHPVFPAVEVDRIRGEIVTNIRQDEDSPAVMAAQAALGLLYGDSHPYGRRVRGTVESVEGIGRDSLRAFHARMVTPASLVLVMVGDIDPSLATDAAGRAFGSWSASTSPPAPFPGFHPAPARRVRLVPMMNKPQADIAYGLIAVPRSDPRFPAFALMHNVLGEYSLGGRLGDSIRERQGMAYYAFSSFDANISGGHILVRAGVAPANVDRALVSIDQEVERMAAEGPTDQELAESKQYLVGSMPRRLETNVGIASFLQTMERFGLGMDYDVRMPDLFAAVTRDDVFAAAGAVLRPATASVGVAGPYSGVLSSSSVPSSAS